jgi:O-methyltransferase
MFAIVKTTLKRLLAPILYRFPPVGLQPSELGTYLHELRARKDVPGDVAEVGCAFGGTACIAAKIVQQFSPAKQYICHDTFGGFVQAQVQADIDRGSPGSVRSLYSSNDVALVRRILDLHGCDFVRLVPGDLARRTIVRALLRHSSRCGPGRAYLASASSRNRSKDPLKLIF